MDAEIWKLNKAYEIDMHNSFFLFNGFMSKIF